jgi:hypothetical protein
MMAGMDDDLELRVAANEARLRQVNEAIERGQWPGDTDPVSFRCECAFLGCNQMTELTVPAYEQIRAHPRRFLVLPDHVCEDVERVVDRKPGYAVVEKIDAAGELAEATDPRD